jgi:hypothetical protein
MMEIDDWVEEKRRLGGTFHTWKKFGDGDDYINLNIMFDSHHQNYDLHLNRNRSKFNFTNERGCVMPRENAKEISDWLAMQILDEFRYVPGSGNIVNDFGNTKFELIKRFSDARNNINFIDFCYMVNDYGNKFFLVNNMTNQKSKKGVEISIEIIRDLITEIRKFCKNWNLL